LNSTFNPINFNIIEKIKSTPFKKRVKTISKFIMPTKPIEEYQQITEPKPVISV